MKKLKSSQIKICTFEVPSYLRTFVLQHACSWFQIHGLFVASSFSKVVISFSFCNVKSISSNPFNKQCRRNSSTSKGICLSLYDIVWLCKSTCTSCPSSAAFIKTSLIKREIRRDQERWGEDKNAENKYVRFY